MATIKVILYKGKTLKDGSHPIMLQVTNNGVSKRRSIGYSSLEEQWNRAFSLVNKFHPNEKDINKRIKKININSQNVMDWFDLYDKPFSIDLFFMKMSTGIKPVKLIDRFDRKIKTLVKEDRIGTSKVYEDSRRALKRHLGKREILLQDVTYNFLKDFERFLRISGCNGGIRVYMECIRSIYNEAIGEGMAKVEDYPFARNKSDIYRYHISRLRGDVKPRAMSKEDRDKWKAFDLNIYPELCLTFLIQSFLYYAHGMNFTDMARLQWSDIYDGRITYKRSKTKRFIDLRVSEHIDGILKEFKGGNKKGYIFPILNPEVHKTEIQIKNRIKKCLKKHNQQLKLIASILDIGVNLTSYVARHSYAMALLENQVSEMIIGRNLGHAAGDSRTVKHYLGKLNGDVFDETDKFL